MSLGVARRGAAFFLSKGSEEMTDFDDLSQRDLDAALQRLSDWGFRFGDDVGDGSIWKIWEDDLDASKPPVPPSDGNV